MNLLDPKINPQPLPVFNEWFQHFEKKGLPNPNAMMVASCSETGKPSLRTVLLKEFDEQGFVFFTNLQSRKSQEIRANSEVALLFYWEIHQRQVRIEGCARAVSDEQAENYFSSRPYESKIAAWASNQSEKIVSREELENQFVQMRAKYPGPHVPLPPFWGGFCVAPRLFEFWQGLPNRLHHRVVYELAETEGLKQWSSYLIAP